MDGDRFDALTKALGSGVNRRAALKRVTGGAMAAAMALGLNRTEAAARKRSYGNACRLNADCVSNICMAQGGGRSLCACGGDGDCASAADPTQCQTGSCTAGVCSAVSTCTGNQTCHSGTCSSPCPGITGTDPETGAPWIVCRKDASTAWVSMNGSSGSYHALQICQSLGYSQLGSYGGTCGSTCGYCNFSSTCDAPGSEVYDNGGYSGSDAFGPILGMSVNWECLI